MNLCLWFERQNGKWNPSCNKEIECEKTDKVCPYCGKNKLLVEIGFVPLDEYGNISNLEVKIRQLVKDKILFEVRPKENRIDIIIDMPTETRIISFDKNGKWLMESSITHEENGIYASRKF